MRHLLFQACFFIGLTGHAQLLSGPMVGYVEHNEAAIWVELGKVERDASLEYWPANDVQAVQVIPLSGELDKPFTPITVKLTFLEMDTRYYYTIKIDGKKTGGPWTFKTKMIWEHRVDPPAFSFLMGSCFYINDPPADRPGEMFGQDIGIIQTMSRDTADFMLWLGDNLYLREPDITSRTGIYNRYHHTRSQAFLQPLLQRFPHYAVWDDHDYGPNNSGKEYILKDASLQAFRDYWPQRDYGHDKDSGTYTAFSWNDCDFFMMDDRYHRAPENFNGREQDKSFFGKKQMEWLKFSLLQSKASFKFIVCGSQMLNENSRFDAFSHYRSEFEELMEFLVKHHIQGIVFLSGDRHFSEIIGYRPNNFYEMWDVTCSPLTSRPYAKIGSTAEGDNPQRIAGTMTPVQNYMKLTISGSFSDRVVHISCINSGGEELWLRELKARDLKP